MSPAHPAEGAYAESGVDTDAAESELKAATELFKATWPARGLGAVRLDFRYFANVIEIADNLGLAVCTDGVGSKALIAQMMRTYDTIGIDCVAMNVNDLICVGARPLTFVDYLAVEEVAPGVIREIAKGLHAGAVAAGVSLSGGETAQLPDVIKGAGAKRGFDIAGTAVGTVALDRMLIGENLQDGDAVVGIESNGIHSNGLSLARRVFFKDLGLGVGDTPSGLTAPVGEELLRPTHIYVKEALELIEGEAPVKAAMHVTGDGFMNLTRVASEVGYVLDGLPEVPPVFRALATLGGVAVEEMYGVFNMGIGFCLVVERTACDDVIAALAGHGRKAWRIGSVTRANPGTVEIPKYDLMPYGLVGEGKHFRRA
jgi:phosphoribosylformylglycinamidine cyclo-ligase